MIGRRRAALALLAVGAGLAGCGGVASEDRSSGAAPPQSDELRACLQEHGVEMPEPGAAPEGAPADGTGSQPGEPPEIGAEAQQAFEACSEYAPAGGAGTPPGGPPAGAASTTG